MRDDVSPSAPALGHPGGSEPLYLGLQSKEAAFDDQLVEKKTVQR